MRGIISIWIICLVLLMGMMLCNTQAAAQEEQKQKVITIPVDAQGRPISAPPPRMLKPRMYICTTCGKTAENDMEACCDQPMMMVYKCTHCGKKALHAMQCCDEVMAEMDYSDEKIELTKELIASATVPESVEEIKGPVQAVEE